MLRPALLVAFVSTLGCDGDDLSKIDAGFLPDASMEPDAGTVPPDSGVDAGVEEGPFPCEPLSAPSPETPGATTGRIEVVDYDFWDDIDGRRARVRNAGINFFTGTLPPVPLATAALFPAVAVDQCVVADVLAPTQSLRPARNIGLRVVVQNEARDKMIILRRMVEVDGIRYTFPTTEEAINFFDPDYLAFRERWTYATEGDPNAGVRPASATVEPMDDFVLLSPRVSSSSTAAELDGSFTWTSTGTKGLFSIILGRALGTEGDARYAICHPEDDGSFQIPSSIIADFAPTPGLPFDVLVSRASAAPFCNEGVPSGLILHVIAYLGGGLVR